MGPKRKEPREKERDSLEWLLESSGKFTTDESKYFLKFTKLPPDFLKMCVEYLTRSRQLSHVNKKNHGTLSTLSKKEQNQILQMSRRTKYDFLRLFRDEIQAEGKKNVKCFKLKIRKEMIIARRTLRVAWKIVKGLGRANLNMLLDEIEGSYDGIGVCPRCHILFFKDGGCGQMICPSCLQSFRFNDVELETDLLRTMKSSKLEQAKRVFSEILFRKRLLETAEKLLLSSLDADKKNKRRPLLNNEDHSEIIESIHREKWHFHSYKYNDDRRLSCSIHCVDEEGDGETNENTFETHDALVACESDSFSRLKEEVLNDEFSFSECTVGTTPSESISLCDYIFVSGHDKESIPLPWNHQGRDWDEECSSSYSLLSGCNSVYSLEDNDAKPKGDMVLSYCKVAKLGNQKVAPQLHCAAIEFQNHESKSEQKSHTDQENDACASTITSATSSAGRYFDEDTVSYNEEYCDYDDYYYWDDPEYEAAKSGHGGRVSCRFKGNSRTTPPVSGWGKHRRPNWTRKRRKEWKRKYL